MSPLEQLKSVLCEPDGTCCIAGSDEDRAIIDRALQALAQPEQEPTCPECKAIVLYECVACSSNNYPPQRTEPIQSLQCFHCQVTIETLNDKVMHLMAERKPLTDEEAFKLVEQDNRMEEYVEAAVRLIRRTEAAHGIKENT
jgi:hypothetical protein